MINTVMACVAMFSAGLLLGTTVERVDVPIKEIFITVVLIAAAGVLLV